MNFDTIPTQITAVSSWCLYKLVVNGATKPKKVPYAINGKLASVNDPLTWTTFDNVKTAYLAQPNEYAGIGFVLSESDSFCVVDLDDADGDPRIIDNQRKIYEQLNSWTEYSPSGKGLHTWCIAKTDNGTRDAVEGVEIYSNQRFMTVTGNVYNNVNIAERNSVIAALVAQINNVRRPVNADFDCPQVDDDNTVGNRIWNGKKSAVFQRLWADDWANNYKSRSEAAIDLMNIICAYTDNRDQVKRLFLASSLALADTKYSKRPKLLNDLVSKGFDLKPAPLDLGSLLASVEQWRATQHQQASITPAVAVLDDVAAIRAPDAGAVLAKRGGVQLTWPSGMLCELARFVWNKSRYPLPETAITGALAYAAGLCASAFNVQGKGLNLYFILVAPTGANKSSMKDSITEIVDDLSSPGEFNLTTQGLGRPIYVGAGDMLAGTTHFASGSAFIKAFKGHFTSLLNIKAEAGNDFARMLSENASGPDRQLLEQVTEAWENCGPNSYTTGATHSDNAKDAAKFKGCAYSWLAESVAEMIEPHITEKQVNSGFLQRILWVRVDDIGTLKNPDHFNHKLPADMRGYLGNLTARVAQLKNLSQSQQITLTEDAKTFIDNCEERNRAGLRANSFSHYYKLSNRNHAKALRIAGLMAVLDCGGSAPVITLDQIKWAMSFADICTHRLSERFDSGYISDNSDDSRRTAVVEFFKKYLDLAGDVPTKRFYSVEDRRFGKLSHSYLKNAVGRVAAFNKHKLGAATAFKQTLQELSVEGIVFIDSTNKQNGMGNYDGVIYLINAHKL